MTSSRFRISNPPWDRWFLSGICAVIPLTFFIAAAARYIKYDFVDRKTSSLIGWQEACNLIVLFALPLFGLAISMVFLVRKARHDRAVNRFYGLCLVFIAVGPFGFSLLWLLYVCGWHASQNLSYVALLFIALLLVIVGFVTYLLMWTPSGCVTLNDNDIVENMSGLCSTLCQAEEKEAPAHMVKLFGVFSDALKKDLKNADATDEFRTLKLDEIINRLNSVVQQEGFFEKHFHDMEPTRPMRRLRKKFYHSNLSAEQRQRISALLNLMLLQSCLPHVISRVSRLVVIRTVWDGPCEDLMKGMFSSRFVTLIFFFSVFLVVSYLFGFAFAFDDQARVNNSQSPALFMARTHPSGATAPSPAPDQNTQALQWPEFTFYFDASLNVGANANDKDFDELLRQTSNLKKDRDTLRSVANESKIGFSRNPKRRRVQAQDRTNKDLKQKELELEKAQNEIVEQLGVSKLNWNDDHVTRLARAIEDEVTNGKRVVLELKLSIPFHGNESGQDTKPNPKPPAESIYVREEQIKRQIQYLLLSQNNHTVPRNIEWFAPHPPIGQTKSGQLHEKYEKELANLAQVDRAFSFEKKTIDASPWLSAPLNDRLSQIGEIERQHEEQPDDQVINHKLEDSVIMLRDLRQFMEANYADEVSPKEATAAAVSAADVAVSVRPVRDTFQYIPLGLMDYMYFTMYTITTTGYGDIVPTTNYAKFLCTLANILEVFFLVVFFNALLAGKMQRQDQRLAH